LTYHCEQFSWSRRIRMDGGTSRTHEAISFGLFCLIPAERQLKKGDERLQLGSRALDTLVALAERAGEVVAQRDLISRVWPDVTVDEVNLRIQIALLRKALGDGRDGARYIATVPGRGYCFVAPVTRSTRPSSSTPQPLSSRPIAVADRLQTLPPTLARMIGRDEIVRLLSSQLMMHRLVSVVCAGGIGKTTVAISVAHALLDDFNGAVFFVDLSALTDAELVPGTVARAIGFMVQAEDPLRSLPAFIGDRKILLVLDNCEHVIDSAAMVAELLIGETPQAHVLTTSREALRVEGEHVHLLYALDCPPEDADLTAGEALRYPAAQLFMERAAAGGYHAALSDTDAPIVATICRRLDGIALAIELAASRAGSFGIRGIAQLLDNRLGLVWRGRRTALPRHQTLNAMFDWSYNLLSPHEKAVLNRLSVFVGHFRLEAACSVASDGEIDEGIVADAIASLLAKSLLSTTALHGLTYYRLLETTRIFAQTKLAEPSEANRVAVRHAEYYKPSIAVLAFNNMSGDPEQEYFSDGISENVITDLSKLSELRVIARNSSFTYKGKPVDVKQVGRDLGVRHVLEGSVRKAGNRVRVTAQLIDAESDAHIWADRFDRDLTDVFEVQEELTKEIIAALKITLNASEKALIVGSGTKNVDAYDFFLRGRALWHLHTKEGKDQALEMLTRALELDPHLASASALSSLLHQLDYLNQWSRSPLVALERGRDAALRAMALDNRDPYALWALGSYYLWSRRLDEAVGELEKAISLSPNLASAVGALGLVLHYAGQPEEAIECFSRAMALDPYGDFNLHYQAQAYFQLGSYEKATALLEQRLARNPHTDISRVLLAASYGHLGRREEARVEWQEAFRVNPNYSLKHRRKVLPYRNSSDFESLMEGLRKAGLVV
jgi:predicted ATPase/DNA-binding winged helix-turn-helix (wHTH) protein/Flp pilus assembly protein TadD